MRLCDWPEHERPREKLMCRGAAYLSDAELLALLLQSGTRGLNAVDLSRQLLRQFGSLDQLLAAEVPRLRRVTGLGPGKVARLQAVRELGLRQLRARMEKRDLLSSSTAARDYLRSRYRHHQREVFSCLFLTNQHHVVQIEELFSGTIDGAAVYPREVVKRCLYHNAAAVIFAHNHPSGVAEPSQADIAITGKLRAALGTIEVRVLDHLVLGADSVVSMAERELL